MTSNKSTGAGAAGTEILNFIGGEYRKGGGRLFENYYPATGQVHAHVHEASREDVDLAVGAAKQALKGPWGRMSVAERLTILRKVADGIQARFDEFLRAEIMDTGKPRSIASHIDIPRGGANFNVFADQIASLSTEAFQSATPDGAGAINYAIRVPRGVIAVICPWNLPLLLMTWKVAPAMAAGNTVVVKPSEETPATAALLGEVMNAAGVPAGVYNVVHGFGADSAGEFLTSHPDVDGITFTGETSTGEAIMRAASNGVRPVSLELGGKNAGIIFNDADLAKAIEGTGRSCFANTGQVCLATERLYVQRGIFEEFCAKLTAQAKSYRFGDPFNPEVTMGPLVSDIHRQKVLGFYEKAKAEGATILCGGGTPDVAGFENGYFVEPTLWTGLPQTSEIVTNEIFGPCAHISVFDDEEEVVGLANNSPYGLATAVWTENLSRAHRVASQIDVGIAWVNSWFLRDLRTPFGGSKKSGIGREGGNHSFEFYTELRNICIKL
ncbi:aminomuconate-semialdehyde/2-hydroxymuconate-6-semialdehyde dehydrogenase [Paenochrobactrum gallinarii]|uniref:Aminomuconate-semialdehyde/2-hydroxymuconate-6-semialdehyde dehydrogenase n=1 Tax=Paenochrobactrum gallinarii TaxID=643673 RepID=A0A841M454_9HYPH|nr:2-hydroxymuconic semialdehyde dehydrogenase [Paenochrobactrum gallinarii]MBB6260364.1 aminomuconate-semialdehyde/2-hydroxymuconate-6-semialdehyde dehydrogenase [Paenochrobactrum gallinarii]